MRIVIDGEAHQVAEPMTLAAALVLLCPGGTWRSVSGQLRLPVCGMGTCHECRVTVDGQPSVRACLMDVRDGMVVQTGGPG
jgi:D-hydroxyproline dehydrogenase subunit gamma